MMITMKLGRLLVPVVAALLLSACGKEPAAPAVETVALTQELQDIYQTSCAVCHGTPGTGAPQTGVAADWQERINTGMDAMLDKVMNGYQGMPAMGGCFHCSEDDFRQLFRFMTAGQLK